MKMNVLYITVFLATVMVVGLLLLYFAKMRLRFEQRTVHMPKISDVPVGNITRGSSFYILWCR
jgi:hypothetical protein